MALVQTIRNMLECDGCQAIFGPPNEFTTGMEARAAAYADGWRFPALTGKHGDELRSGTSDACPRCISDWTPRTRKPQQRRATDAEMRRWSMKPADPTLSTGTEGTAP